MNIIENFENKVKNTGKKDDNIRDLLIKSVISHILAAMYLRPMNKVQNLILGSGLSFGGSHMQTF